MMSLANNFTWLLNYLIALYFDRDWDGGLTMFAVTSAPQFIRDHCWRISAKLLGIVVLVHLELLATLHEIEKVGIAENILNKQGILDE